MGCNFVSSTAYDDSKLGLIRAEAPPYYLYDSTRYNLKMIDGEEEDDIMALLRSAYNMPAALVLEENEQQQG